MQNYNKYGFIFLLAIIVLLASCNRKHPKTILNGKLDLSDVELAEDFCFELNGEWEFYWDRLLYPEDFEKDLINPEKYFYIPKMWRSDKSLRPHGYATYRLRVLLPEYKSNLTLNVGEVVSSYRLFVNGELAACNGNIHKSPKKTTPGFYPVKTYIKEKTKSIDLVLQTANFHHANGGVFGEIVLGTEKAVTNYKIRKAGFELILFGSLLIMALYHLGLFIINRKDMSAMFFAAFSAIIALRILFVGEKTILHFLTALEWDMIYRLDYITLFISPVFFLLFIKELFKKEIPKNLVTIFVIIGLSFSVIVLTAQVKFFSQLITFYQFVVVLLAVYILYIFIKSKNRERKEIVILIIGGGLVFITLLNDIFFSRGVIRTTELFPVGIFLFVLCQSFLISMRNVTARNRNMDMAIKLDYNKKNLERIVKERTSQLSIRNQEIANQWEKLKTTNAALEKQKLDLQKQRREMETINNLLEAEKAKSEKLLFSILPGEIAEELKTSGTAKTKSYSNVAVMFTDFADFSAISQSLNPDELVQELHYCFSNFDDILEKYKIDKIKTIGDAYMCAGGLTDKPGNWCVATVLVAQEIRLFMTKYQNSRQKTNKPFFKVRIGIHSGSVISGVVGKSKFAFDIWGHTVNTASHMESACSPQMLNISYDVYTQVKQYFDCESRGKISVKHKTDLEMFYVKRIKPEYSADQDGFIPNDLLIKTCELKLRFKI